MANVGRPSKRQEHVQFIRENHGKMTRAEMARRLGILPATLNVWLRWLGLYSRLSTRRDDYTDFILANLGKLSEKEMAQHIGVSLFTITQWVKRLGVPDCRRKIDPAKYDAYFRESVQTKTRRQMAAELGVNMSTISRHLSRLGISARKAPKEAPTLTSDY